MTLNTAAADPLEVIIRVQLEVVDRLADEFPQFALRVICDEVGRATAPAQAELPNVAACRDTMEREARMSLSLQAD
jgi:hypothetical protein